MTRREVDEKTLAQIASMQRQLAELTGQVAALIDVKDRTEERNALRDQIEEKKRELARMEEERQRQERTTRHEVGLLKTKWEQDKEHQQAEIEIAREKALLEVRQENLSADRARFDDQIRAQQELFTRQAAQLEKHAGDLKELMTTFLQQYDFKIALGTGRPAAPAARSDK